MNRKTKCNRRSNPSLMLEGLEGRDLFSIAPISGGTLLTTMPSPSTGTVIMPRVSSPTLNPAIGGSLVADETLDGNADFINLAK